MKGKAMCELVMKMAILCLWVMMMVVSCSGCWEQERIALLHLKANINYPNGTSLPSWVDEETADCCRWERVECNTTTLRVTGLSLNHTRDYWKSGDWNFNASLFLSFEELRKLFLPQNFITGWVENEGFDRLMKLSSLEFLDLGGNELNNNSILPSLSGFSSLKSLNLGYNQLKGSTNNTTYAGFGRLSGLCNLEVLDLSGNELNNNILSFLELHDFVSLKELDISDNKIEHFELNQDIRGLSNLSTLEVLDLSLNYFNNPAAIGGLLSLSSLKVLDLSYNQFNISIFSSLRGLLSLKSLYIEDNQLIGSIHLEGLQNLEELDVSGNEIDSLSKPQGIENSCKLKVLSVVNSVSDTDMNASRLLQSLGAFPSLRILYLEYNNFKGTIAPQELRNLSNVEELFLWNSLWNPLRNSSVADKNFVESIEVMTSLKVLSLSNCEINNSLLVQGLCELKNLQKLDLSFNEFEGTIPSCFGNLTSLRWVDLSFNQFTGNISLSPLASLTSLEYLALSDNHFQIPISLGLFANHSRLEVFLGDNNKFIVEPIFYNWVPTFQLKYFSMASCTLDKANKNLPNFLYYQHDLRVVDLSHNNLGGTFPSWLLWNNTRLITLYLRDNTFRGSLNFPSNPNSNLLRIDISENKIEGHIPTNISSIFPNLVFLNMSRNLFSGNIIFCFNDMKFLSILDLSTNFLSGIIPEQLVVSCPLFRFLKLSNNYFHGQISPKISSLTSLEYLHLNGNNFTGEVPSSLSTLFLSVLDFSNNHLSGELPRLIGNIKRSIAGIVMSKNQFEGHIPVEFCKLEALKFLDLSENNLSGSIPSCINQLSIRHVHLHKNSLQGPLTQSFYNGSFLVTLDLRENRFSGKIPDWIGQLSWLSVLLLQDNHFQGEIPIELCQLSKLSIMDLSRNNLSGRIPHCLSNITSESTHETSTIDTGYEAMNTVLYEIEPGSGGKYFSEFQKKNIVIERDDYYPMINVQEEIEFTTKWRSESYKGGILNFMSGIDLSCNQLTGEIPSEIGNLNKIHALNLSHNSLNGSIPTTLSNLSKLESLDLSYNNLNGRIPLQLTELTFLEVFSVAQNNLSGTTPERKAQFATFEESSYEGNPLLCGPPLHNDCITLESPSSMQDPSDKEEEDTRFIDMGVFHVSFVVSYISVLLGIAAVLYINPYWRQRWFYLVELCITISYYFVLDHFPKLPNFRNM